MALARDASESDLARYGPTRKSAARAARNATSAGDKRRRENREVVPVSAAKEDKAKRDREKWADDFHAKAADTMRAQLRRENKRARKR